MKKLAKIQGTPLGRSEMKSITGGVAPAGKLYRCWNGLGTTYSDVCAGGGADPVTTCGYVSCEYLTTCVNTDCGLPIEV